MTISNYGMDLKDHSRFSDMNLLDALLKNSYDYIYFKDKDSRFIEINEKAAWAIGAQSPEEAIGKSDYDYFPEIAEQTRADEAQIMETGQAQINKVVQVTFSDGKQHRLSICKVPFYDQENNVQGTISISGEITEKEELRPKHQRIFNMSSELICEADINTATFKKINPAFTKTLGYKEAELLSKSFIEFIHPDDREPTRNVIDEKLKNGEKVLSFINRYRCKSGSYVWLDWNSFPVPEEGIIYAVARNITHRRKTKELLEKSEKKFRGAFEFSNIGMALVNPEGEFINVNKRVSEILGYTKEEMMSKSFVDITHPEDVEESKREFFKLLNGEIRSYEIQKRYIHKNGQTIYGNLTIASVRDDKGNVQYSVAQLIDKTIETKTFNALRKSEKKYRSLYESQVNGFAIFKSIFNYQGEFISYEFIDINPAYERITGVKRKEVIGKDIQEVFPGTEQSWIDAYGGVAISGESKTFEMYHDPTKKYYFCNVFRLEDDKTQFCVAFNDVTERKLNELKISESEEKYHALFNAMAQGVVYQNADGEITSANPAAERILGLTLSQMQGRSSLDPRWRAVDMDKNFLPGEKHPAMIALRTGKRVIDFLQGVFNPQKKDYVWILVNSVPQFKDGDDKPFQVFSTFLDVTERINSENIIKNLALFPAQNPNPVLRINYDGKILYSNDAGLELLKFKNIGIGDFIPDIKRDYLRKVYDSKKNTILNYSYLEKTYLLSLTPIYDKGYINVYGQDITDQKNAEQKLIESEEKYRNIVNLAPDGILTMNLKGVITSANQAFSSLTGYSNDEIVGKHFTKLPTISSINISQYLPIIKNILTGASSKTIDFKWKNKQGELRHGQAKISLMRINDDKKSIQAILRDTTEEKRAERELKRAHEELKNMNADLERIVEERTLEIQRLLVQKDELINQMGHDLKNPLGPIVNLMPVLMKYETDPKKLEMMNAVHKSALYMKNLVIKSIKLAKIDSDMVDFNYELLCLDEVVSEIIDANELLFKENNINVQNSINFCHLVHADKLQLQELFSNLFNNAVKFTEGSGTIRVDAEELNGELRVSVSDQGIGMTEEQLTKVFDEFYKADESRHDFDSSGLGMSICKRIVEKHGGQIWAESPGLGKGSTFYFTLPKSKNLT